MRNIPMRVKQVIMRRFSKLFSTGAGTEKDVGISARAASYFDLKRYSIVLPKRIERLDDFPGDWFRKLTIIGRLSTPTIFF